MSLIARPVRLLFATALAATGFFFAQPASAAGCIVNPLVGFSPQTIDVVFGPINVPSTLLVGEVILTRSFPVTPKPSNTFICDLFGPNTSDLVVTQAHFSSSVPGLSRVLTTAVPGVGIRIRQTVTVKGGGATTVYYTSIVEYGLGQWFGIPDSDLVVELIKTSNSVGSGPIGANGVFAHQRLNYLVGPIIRLSLRDGGATVKPPTCSPHAGSQNIAVNFGSVSSRAFSGVGAVAANRDFNIELDCHSSDVAGASVGVRVDAIQDDSNLPGVLPLNAAADAASGIGIQMVRRAAQGEQPLRFGENVVLATGAMNAGTLVLPLSARYIQTKAGAVLPGKAGGSATFTIQYN